MDNDDNDDDGFEYSCVRSRLGTARGKAKTLEEGGKCILGLYIDRVGR